HSPPGGVPNGERARRSYRNSVRNASTQGWSSTARYRERVGGAGKSARPNKAMNALAKRPQRRLSAHCIPNEHGHKINQFILAHPSPHKSHALLYGFEDSVPLERVRHHDDLPKPGWRTRRVCWVHLDLDDRI